MDTSRQLLALTERISRLEEELAKLKAQVTGEDWIAKIVEEIKKDDLFAAIQIYQNHVDRWASISEATRHVMDIKKKHNL